MPAVPHALTQPTASPAPMAIIGESSTADSVPHVPVAVARATQMEAALVVWPIFTSSRATV